VATDEALVARGRVDDRPLDRTDIGDRAIQGRSCQHLFGHFDQTVSRNGDNDDVGLDQRRFKAHASLVDQFKFECLVGLGPHSSNVGPDAATSGESKRPADQADTDDR
jgi:hypothetical protein